MFRLLARRLATVVPLLLVISFAVFVLIDLSPGDPAYRLAGENPTPQQVETVRRALGLGDPLLTRYTRWLREASGGSLGRSLATTEPVTAMIGHRAPVTLSLTLVALVLSIAVGLAAGTAAALHEGRLPDRLITAVASLGIALPAFWIGLLLVIFFAVDRSWFPALGYQPLSGGVLPWLRSLALPAVTLAILPAAELVLQVRASLVEVLGREYVTAARARGLSPTRIVLKHAMKNAAVPVVTVLGFRVAQLLGGAVVIESVFVLNGLGTLAVTATLASDLPVMLGLTVLTTLTVVLINLLVDASYLYFSPKARPS